MPTKKKLTTHEMAMRHEDQDYDPFASKSDTEIERVTGKHRGGAPISLRLSEPLLDRLDHIAQQQRRSRSNLIQYILWAYAHKEKH